MIPNFLGDLRGTKSFHDVHSGETIRLLLG
jgi:hypothetical protein